MKVEGWYIDLPEWTCPVSYAFKGGNPSTPEKPDCQDKFIARTSGNGKLGFPLWERRIMYFNDGSGKVSEMVTEVNTIELTTTKLDSLLFTIPPGYTETKNAKDLEDAFDVNAYINQVKDYNPDHHNNDAGNANSGDKPAGMIRIGILLPMGGESVDAPALQQYLVQVMRDDKVQAVAVSGEEDAKSKQCDYLLHSNLPRMKQASKVGGIIKAIKNTDPNAASSWNIDAELKLTSLADGSVKSQENVSGKYSGKPDNAAQQALGEGAGKVLRALR
jgi:hypothetical protein